MAETTEQSSGGRFYQEGDERYGALYEQEKLEKAEERLKSDLASGKARIKILKKNEIVHDVHPETATEPAKPEMTNAARAEMKKSFADEADQILKRKREQEMDDLRKWLGK